jgi:O-succinylbenzoic acid--CoA ligase
MRLDVSRVTPPSERPILRAALHDAEGRAGHGEACPLPRYSREDVPACEQALESVSTRIADLDDTLSPSDAVDAVMRPLEDALAPVPSARFALETALFDLVAQRRGLSVAACLGGAGAYDAVPLNGLLWPESLESLADRAAACAAHGVAALKIKLRAPLWHGFVRELDALREVRARLPLPFEIRLDANAAWSEDEARRRLEALAPIAPTFVEQPVAADRLPFLGPCAVPWAADESLARPDLVEALLAAPGCVAFVLKPAMIGGLLPARNIALRAQERGLGVVFTHLFDGPYALAACAELALSLPRPPLACGLAPHRGLAAFGAESVPQIAVPRVARSSGGPGLRVRTRPILDTRAIDAEAPRLVLSTVAATPDAGRTALLAGGVATTFGDLAARADRVRGALLQSGVDAGARVALISRNSVDAALAVYALLDLGATIVPIHPRLTPSEVDALLVDAAPARTLREPDLAALAAASPTQIPPLRAHDPAAPLAMVYTSGTTGRPKGAVLPRRAFLASAAASAQNLGWTEDDRWLCCLPICHVGGLSILTRCLVARRAVILEPRFDADAVLASIARDRATILSVVPTMLAALLERDTGNVLARLRAVLSGGAATPFALLEECGRRGIPVITTYGLTEACSQVTTQRLSSPYRPERGSGEPLSGVELRIVDPGADGVGRIEVRGPTLMTGYFRAPPLEEGAWLDTGDLGMLDGRGALHVHARRTDLVVTGGENVYPLEVEDRLASLPGVRRALVFGVPDERWGQIVAAAIELAPGAVLADVAAGAATILAPHKRPRLACAVAELPLTASGKVERARAVERYAAALAPFGV